MPLFVRPVCPQQVAAAKKKRLECDLVLGDLHVASTPPLATILEAFRRELKATHTFKSYKTDYSRVRVFFGPLCELTPWSPSHEKNATLLLDSVPL
jgi:hypothetical protein